MDKTHSNFIEIFEQRTSLTPTFAEDGAGTAIYNKVDLRKLLNISFGGPFFGFVENDKDINEMITDFARFVSGCLRLKQPTVEYV